MQITERILTHNDCYKAGKTIVPKGIMVHSTGVAQPDVEVFLNTWDKPDVDMCVHAFVHRGGVVETLPWNWRGWHAGSPPEGGISANNTHIAFEILEPAGHTYRGGAMVDYDVKKNAGYFAAVYQNAVELCAYLCRRYQLDPLRDIIDHEEGHALGIATNHADVMQWFPKHNKSMDTLRADVRTLLEGGAQGMTQEQFDALLAANAQAVAGRGPETWAEAAWKKAVSAGLFDGSKPQAPLTREQAALVLERLGLLEKPAESSQHS